MSDLKFYPQTTNDAVEVGAMFDEALERFEDLNAILCLHTRATIAAALIGRGMDVNLKEAVNRIIDELTEDCDG